MVGQSLEIEGIAKAPGRGLHVIQKSRSYPIRRGHPHIGRAPARVAAGLHLLGLVQQQDVDRKALPPRLFGG
jgi:hypothetical protein